MAWASDISLEVDRVNLLHGSHLCTNSPNVLVTSSFFGESNTVLHVIKDGKLIIGNTLNVNTFVYEQATLRLINGSTITMGHAVNILGTLISDNTVTLDVKGILNLAAQDVFLKELNVEQLGRMTIDNSNSISITAKDVSVDGAFQAGTVETVGWESFSVGPRGSVAFMPATINTRLGRVMEIRGSVQLGQPLSIRRPCDRLVIDAGGSLSWTGDAATILECANVTINGVFKPACGGSLNLGTGVGIFMVGPSGDVKAKIAGPFITNSFSLAGSLEICNKVIFQSGNSTDGRIEVFIVHSPRGKLRLDTSGLPVILVNGTAVPTTGHSTIKAKYITVDGLLDPKLLDVGPGYEKATVGEFGNFTFTPHGDFRCHNLYVNGLMSVLTPVTMRSFETATPNVREIEIGPKGTLILDAPSHAGRTWTGVSFIGVHTLKVGGKFLGGHFSGRLDGTGGWDTMTITQTGSFILDPYSVDDLYLNYADINGTFQTFHQIIIRENTRSTVFFVGRTGKVTFDTLAVRSTRSWTNPNGSALHLDQVHVHGTMMAGLLTVGNQWLNFKVGPTGIFKYEPIHIWTIVSSEIAGQVESYIPMDHLRALVGTTLVILPTGKWDMDYQGPPATPSSGCTNSSISMGTVEISGKLWAGSLNILATALTVKAGGSMDVSGGGYLSGAGPGQSHIYINQMLGLSYSLMFNRRI